MGAGPKNCSPGVLQAMAHETSGHLVGSFLEFMDATLLPSLRWLFDTSNELVLPISGPGTASMETCVFNLVEPGDHVVACIGGAFAGRLMNMAGRLGADLTPIEFEWGTPVDANRVDEVVGQVAKKSSHGRPPIVMAVGAETDTGTWTQLKDVAEAAHNHEAIVVADLVTLIAGHPVSVDDWQLDAAYFGPQKCVGGPPGVSAVTFGPRAVAKIEQRETPVASWMADLNNVIPYLTTGQRSYTTTPGVHAFYGLARAISELQDEGLENAHRRHAQNMEALWAGLRAMGLVDGDKPPYQLNSIVVARVENEAEVRKELEDRFNIEVSAGLGPMKGKGFRIGPMGPNSTREDVLKTLEALNDILAKRGDVPANIAVAAAEEVCGAANV